MKHTYDKADRLRRVKAPARRHRSRDSARSDPSRPAEIRVSARISRRLRSQRKLGFHSDHIQMLSSIAFFSDPSREKGSCYPNWFSRTVVVDNLWGDETGRQP